MAIVSSFGAMQSLTTKRNQSLWTPSDVGGSLNIGANYMQTYGSLYRTQPNVRICVEFLARNIAQLGVHAFRRIDDDNRQRLSGHDVESWLKRPNPKKTRYRLFEDLVSDMGTYFNAFWLKLRYRSSETGKWRVGLLRLPPEQMSVSGGLLPSEFVWTLEDGTEKPFHPDDIVHFDGYNPSNPLLGVSPMETLRQTLAEVYAAMRNREDFWRNGARFEGVIERPKDARWTPEQRQIFREEMRAFRQGGAKAGAAPVLEDGMSYKPISSDAQKAEYTGGLKLAREICASAYHIPLPLVGILDHATFSNIKEQHKHLYADCLGPWLAMFQQEIERQLLPEAEDQDDVYIEFNIQEKLKGSFEEQSAALHAAVGRPWMTVNEGRARQNLSRLEDPSADQLAAQPGTGDAQLLDDADVDDQAAAAVRDERFLALQAQIQALASRPHMTIVNVPPVSVAIGETKIDAPVSVTMPPPGATRSVHTRDKQNGLILETNTTPVPPAGA